MSELRRENPLPGIILGKVAELQTKLKRVELTVSRDVLSQPKTILSFAHDGIDGELTLTLLYSVQPVMS